jgi:hypothetical protein
MEGDMSMSLKQKWIDALRSGKYTQGRYALEIVDKQNKVTGNCCLGVLCRVAGIEPVYEVDAWGQMQALFYGHTETLPEDFQIKLGLTNNQQDNLVGLNDDEGYSFLEIADYIEENVELNNV